LGIFYCDGERFRKAFLAGASWLSENKEILNQLNVFPVPDGDTGTNMSLTVLSAVEELTEMRNEPLTKVLEGAARGTLMGARGCSGVIFSQLLAGFADVGYGKTKLLAKDIAAGLQLGTEKAYKSVNNPVEGTILTVIRKSSEEAARFAEKGSDIVKLLEVVLNRARITLKDTPNMLPVLAQAGVVDSGGQGFVYMLEGILRIISEDVVIPLQQPIDTPSLGVAQLRVSESWENVYCTEFILSNTKSEIPEIRESLNVLGDDLIVVGWNNLVRVHIHASEPERVLATAHSYGKPVNVKIDDIKKQHSHLTQAPMVSQNMEAEVSIVTTAPGNGIKAVFMSLGAESVVMGKESRNPSVSELMKAVDETYSNEVLLLPNDGNIIPAATQAAKISSKSVLIIPSKNMSQGLSALVTYRTDAGMESNANLMKEALGQVKHAKIAQAVRNVQYETLIIKKDDIIGLFDGKVQIASINYEKTAIGLLKLMLEEDDEIITLFYGDSIAKDEAEKITEEIESCFPDMEVEVHYGGQSYCSYILSIE